MTRTRLLRILEEVLQILAEKLPIPKEAFPLKEETPLESLGIHMHNAQLLMRLLETRLGVQVNFRFLFTIQNAARLLGPVKSYSTVGHMVDHIQSSIKHAIRKPRIVYVDPVPQSQAAFEARFAQGFDLKVFSHGDSALRFILKKPDVVLVICQSWIPPLDAETLRGSIHQYRPYMKIVLVGDEPDMDTRNFKTERFCLILKRPFEKEEEAKALASLMQRVMSGDYF